MTFSADDRKIVVEHLQWHEQMGQRPDLVVALRSLLAQVDAQREALRKAFAIAGGNAGQVADLVRIRDITLAALRGSDAAQREPTFAEKVGAFVGRQKTLGQAIADAERDAAQRMCPECSAPEPEHYVDCSLAPWAKPKGDAAQREPQRASTWPEYGERHPDAAQREPCRLCGGAGVVNTVEPNRDPVPCPMCRRESEPAARTVMHRTPTA